MVTIDMQKYLFYNFACFYVNTFLPRKLIYVWMNMHTCFERQPIYRIDSHALWLMFMCSWITYSWSVYK